MIVYLAAPYTKGDVGQNIKRVIDCADELCALGHIPYIPHLTHLWHLVSPKPAKFWYEYDLVWLDFCDALLRLPGESVGADNEVQVAQKRCIPVYYSVDELRRLGGKMDFDAKNKVIIESMNKEEARAFILFLHSEIARHRRDSEEALDLIITVGAKFGIPIFED